MPPPPPLVSASVLRLVVALLRRRGDAEPSCLGRVAGAATALLWTFVSSSWSRLAGVPSSVGGREEEGLPEPQSPVFCGWRGSGGCWRPCWFFGSWMADLGLLLAGGDGRGRIWWSLFCSGHVPAPLATVIGGYSVYSFSGSSKPFGDGAASALGLLVVAPLPCGVSASGKMGASVLVEQRARRTSV